MKKLVVLILLLISSSCEIIIAQNNEEKPKIVLTPFPGTSSNPTGLNDILPVIEAEFDSHELILSVTNYFGYSDILILKSPNHNVMYDENEYISDSSPLSIDISSFQPGVYVIIVSIDSGEMYTGELII